MSHMYFANNAKTKAKNFFYVLLTFHTRIIFFKWNQLGVHFFLVYLFQLLYMFRTTMCPSSGELTVTVGVWSVGWDESHPKQQTRDPPILFVIWGCGPTRALAPSFIRSLDHKQRLATVGRTPLDEWSARRRDLYLTTHNTYNRQTSMQQVGFEPTISAAERPQTYASDRAATGTGSQPPIQSEKYQCCVDTVSSPDDGHIVARIMYRIWDKYTKSSAHLVVFI